MHPNIKRSIGSLAFIVGIALLPFVIYYLKLILIPDKSSSGISGLEVIFYMPVAIIAGIASVSLCAFGLYFFCKSFVAKKTMAPARKRGNELAANIGLVVLLSIIFILDTAFLIREFIVLGFPMFFLHIFFAYVPEIVFVTCIVLIMKRIAVVKIIRSGSRSHSAIS